MRRIPAAFDARLRAGLGHTIALAAMVAAAVPARAIEPTPGAVAADPVAADPVAAERDAKRAELDAVTRDIAVTAERQAALRSEIEALEKDRSTLNTTLIDTGRRAKELEGQIDLSEKRLGGLIDEERQVKASLAGRRGVLANVLAALQRMGRKPPPAIVVRPEDALASVRSAMLLGAVVPEIRGQAEALANDLQHLIALKQEQEQERDRMRADASALAEERTRIEILIAEKRKESSRSEDQLVAEQKRATELARQATNLKDLIGRMEGEIAAASAAADAAKRAEAEAAAGAGKPPAQGGLGAADRIVPAVAFASAKGLLPRPVNGVETKGFGDPDGLGGTTQGITIATRASARVAAPSDGWVVYAGPFRSYGQLLIINAGGGYHVVLAGMERIDVELGQFVLAGEPVAVMGARMLASAGATDLGGASQPALYVEFRKDGTSIDPAPWWARSSDEKVGG